MSELNTMMSLTISGPVEQMDYAIGHYFLNRSIHPEEAVNFLAGIRKLDKPSMDNPYAEILCEAERLLNTMEISEDYADFSGENLQLDSVKDFLENLQEKWNNLLQDKKEKQEEIRKREDAANLLKHFKSLQENISELFSMRYVGCHLGSLAVEFKDEILAFKEDGILLLVTDEDKDRLWLTALAVREEEEILSTKLSAWKFEELRMENIRKAAETPGQSLRNIEEETDNLKRGLSDLENQKKLLLESEKDALLRRYSYLVYHNTICCDRMYAGIAGNRFYLTGWALSEEAEMTRDLVEKDGICHCTLRAAVDVKDKEAPVILRKRKFAGAFDVILKMYGLPSGGELDPRLFLAISYCIFFGIMFGDVGQGAVLVIAGALLYRKNGGAIWRLFSTCGVFSIFFGCIYNSVFCMEDLLPWGGFHVLEGNNITMALLIAVAVGAVIMVCSMILNVINSVRRRDYQAAFFGPNGLSGMVFYVSVLALVVSLFSGIFPFPKLCVLLLIVLPLVLIWFGEPLGKLLAGDKHWWPKNIGGLLVESFFDIFESLLGYLSNTMSFLRVGAFAISHAGMAMVVLLIGETCSGFAGNLIVMIIGNVFVTVLEAGLASIQIIRLQFYELFGRYYSGHGREFVPLTVNYINN